MNERAIMMQIAEFKALVHSKFIGGCIFRKEFAGQGLFVFTENTREAAIQAMAMQIEASLGSDVEPSKWKVFVIEPGDPARDILALRGYMVWEVEP